VNLAKWLWRTVCVMSIMLLGLVVVLVSLNAGWGQDGPPRGKKDTKWMSEDERLAEMMRKKPEKEFQEQFMSEDERLAEMMRKKPEKVFKRCKKSPRHPGASARLPGSIEAGTQRRGGSPARGLPSRQPPVAATELVRRAR